MRPSAASHSPRFATIRASVPAMLLRAMPPGQELLLDRLLRAQGLRRSQLQDPYECVSMACYVGLLEDAAAQLGRPLLGCELGFAMKPNDILESASIAVAIEKPDNILIDRGRIVFSSGVALYALAG